MLVWTCWRVDWVHCKQLSVLWHICSLSCGYTETGSLMDVSNWLICGRLRVFICDLLLLWILVVSLLSYFSIYWWSVCFLLVASFVAVHLFFFFSMTDIFLTCYIFSPAHPHMWDMILVRVTSLDVWMNQDFGQSIISCISLCPCLQVQLCVILQNLSFFCYSFSSRIMLKNCLHLIK